MTRHLPALGCLILAGLLVAGCGGKKEAAPVDTKKADSSSSESSRVDSGQLFSKELDENVAALKKSVPLVGNELGNAMQAMSKVVAQSENVTITPVDFRSLKTLLPEAVGDFKRTADPSGERQMGVSSAECSFENDAGASLWIKILDTGSMRAMLAGGAAMAMSLDLDKESGTGYERNTTLRGHKAHEKMEGTDGEVTVLVSDRFLIEVRGHGVKAEQLKAAVAALPFAALEGMKDQGIEKAPSAN